MIGSILRGAPPHVSCRSLADGRDDEEVVEEEEATIFPGPRTVGHGHEVVLDQGSCR